MIKHYALLIILNTFLFPLYSQTAINGGFETKTTQGKPKHWDLKYKEGQAHGYISTLDSVTKQEGKYSLHLQEDKNIEGRSFGACALKILSRYQGEQITLKGFIKTNAVKEGWAGLWMRINNEVEMLAFNNMQNNPITGTNDWQEYSITLPLPNDATKIYIGGLLVGEGDAWFDNFRVLIDNLPIEKAEKLLSNGAVKAQ
jgi:hypothetical protein